ncbi:helix-turn-helix transcriptional regulator [Neisseriaceae bacterium TC5R-5]|nr:helix-turn-helix transcriptional regulator [Neisseriaceae bacterium TC5R-5]
MGTNVHYVKHKLGKYVSICKRLREERERLGFNQTDFAAIGGVGRKSQFNYEEGERQPDAAYLAAISTTGADVQYILTGQRQGQGLGASAVHQAVLDAIDLLSLEKKIDSNQLATAITKLAIRSVSNETIKSDAIPADKTTPAKFLVKGDVHGHQIGSVSGGHVQIDINKTKKETK